ncbi:hypothetical protein [Burkholderia sp. LMG 13014]|uniref:hypothetical protein n=1 Tax=Burkholderia sp. LMG 13014 TaxID=2709306 RepID=UPI0019667DE3|nr:hypothetical protein [Burkholderia sp. LMG 13014]
MLTDVEVFAIRAAGLPAHLRASLYPELASPAGQAECAQCGARGPKDAWLCPRSTNTSAQCARAGEGQ